MKKSHDASDDTSMSGLESESHCANLIRSDAAFAKGPNALRIAALGEPHATRIQHQIAVCIGGLLQAERTQQQELTRGGSQQIAPTHHLRDAHGGIIDGTGELIARHAVAAHDDEVSEIVTGDKRLLAKQRVAEANGLTIRHTESPCCCLTFFSRTATTRTGIYRLILVLGMRRVDSCMKIAP